MSINLRQYRKKSLTLLAATILTLVPQSEVLAQSYTNSAFLPNSAEYDVDGVRVALPDWMRITFGNLPPISKGGEITVPRSVVRDLGYDPSRTWLAGQTADSYMMMGDFGTSFQLQEFAIKNIADLVGLDLDNLNLQDYGFVSKQTLPSLLEAIPELEDTPIRKVKPLYDLLNEEGFGFSDNTHIGNIVNQYYDALEDIPLGNLGDDLADYDLDSIPGLTETKIGEYKDWQETFIDEVPGLNYVPFGLFPNSLNNVGFRVLGRADVVFSAAERGDPQARGFFVTGGANRGTAQNPRIQPEDCESLQPCSYLELANLFSIGGTLHGKRWASGETQQVEGGYGFLKFVNGGKEPTGLLPFGSIFKVVMTGANESEGKAEFGLYFRACVDTLFLGYHCTPYVIGPIPWLPVREKDPVIILS